MLGIPIQNIAVPLMVFPCLLRYSVLPTQEIEALGQVVTFGINSRWVIGAAAGTAARRQHAVGEWRCATHSCADWNSVDLMRRNRS